MVSVAGVITHRRPGETTAAVRTLIDVARARRVTLRFTEDEATKHGIELQPFIELVPELGDDIDLCMVLGGDGTILTALRRYAGTGVPVFAVNYGEVGFLATIDPNGLEEDFARAFAGEFDTIELPTISVGRPNGTWSALNDISVHRKAGLRVAALAYALAGEEIGRVRCDGLVIATPQGSTGYNLANGGPVLAWGVEGYVVSFIAPHSLTARALVVAPGDELTINNASREEAVEVHVDGRPTLEVPPGEDIHIAFGLSHLLHNDLLSGLRGNAAQIHGRLQFTNFSPDFCFRIQLFRSRQRHFPIGVFNNFNYSLDRGKNDVSTLLVEIDHQILIAVLFAGSRKHRVLQRVQDDLRIYALLFAQYLDGLIYRSHYKPLSSCL